MKAVLLAALIGVCSALMVPPAALAQSAPSQVVVSAVHNEAELSYLGFLSSFAKLYALLPPEPRHIDLLHRIMFSRLGLVEQDQFVSSTWAISVVSASRDIEVPIVRGGYFILPVDEVALKENAKIIFNAHTPDGVLGMAIVLRMRPGDIIHAADLATAMDEANGFNDKANKTAFYHSPGPFNTVKACFGTASGDMMITNGNGVKSSLGMCKLYVPATTDLDSHTDIAFSTVPTIVVLLPAQTRP